jgi:cellobiose phosphorylase
MLQGFLGFRATATGYEIRPRLPRDWPSLSITGIRFHDELLTITAHADGRVVVERAGEP